MISRSVTFALLTAGLTLGCGLPASPIETSRPTVVPTVVPSPTIRPSATPNATRHTPTATATSGASEPPDGPVPAGSYTLYPFSPDWNGCQYVNDAPPPGCHEPPEAYSVAFNVTVPAGWTVHLGGAALAPERDINHEGPDGMGIVFNRGGWLHDDPCRPMPHSLPAIVVGPTVADFAEALAAHPNLDVSDAQDVTFAGYSGQYMELIVPSDISDCADYRPWEPNLPAFGPDAVWQLPIIDVDGVRVVVESWYYPGTSETDRAELQAVLDSIEIVP